MVGGVTEVLTTQEAAARARVSARTLVREILDGRLATVRIRGCVRILAADLDAYLQSHRQCQSDRTVAHGKSASSTRVRGLAALLRVDETRRNSSAATAPGSKIVALAERRATASRKRSSAG